MTHESLWAPGRHFKKLRSRPSGYGFVPILVGAIAAWSAEAQIAGPQAGRPSATDRPWNRDILVAPVQTLTPLTLGASKVFMERSGVPSVIRDLKTPKRLIAAFQWFPLEESKKSSFDRVGIRVSEDGGKNWGAPWTPVVQGLPDGFQRPFDPTLVQIEDGTYRMYFTSGQKPRFEPGMRPAPGQPLGRPSGGAEHIGIYSAISSDLRVFKFEAGERTDRVEGRAVDCAVAKLGDVTVMFAHLEPPRSPFEWSQGYFATSMDGLKFDRRMNALGPPQGNFIGNLVKLGKELFYIAQGRQGLWSMYSKNGLDWGAPVQSGVEAKDPSFVQDMDGKAWVYFVGPLRKDAVEGPRPVSMDGPEPHLPR